MMIKILFFIDTLTGGGAEKVLRTLVNNMDQTSFDITVMTVWPEDVSSILAEGIHYRSLYQNSSWWNRLRYRAEAALGLCHRLHIRERFQIEVAYLEYGPTKIIAQSPNQSSVKLAWVHCDLQKNSNDSDAFVGKSAPWYKKFDKVLCVSQAVRESYERLFGSVPEALVLHNVVDDEEIRSKADMGTCETTGRRILLSVGRLYEQKGYDRLLRVHNRLQKEGYSYDLWILGEGPERKKLENYLKEQDLSDSVRLLGFSANPYPYIKAADLLVSASYVEGLSTAVTEALILGTPVLATDCAGMEELLGDSTFGLITENSEEGIYTGLKRFLEEESLLELYAQRARERAGVFSKTNILRETEALFVAELQRKQGAHH